MQQRNLTYLKYQPIEDNRGGAQWRLQLLSEIGKL